MPDVVSLTKGKPVSLAKGQVVSLTKDIPGLRKVIVGLGWDAVDKSEPAKSSGFFGKLFGTPAISGGASDIDCDAFAIALSNNMVKNGYTLYYGDTDILGGALHHTGDNLTGGSANVDDEQLIVDLTRVPGDVNKIVIAVNIYRGRERKQSFGNVKNAFIRIVDERDNVEMCRYNLSDDPNYSNYVTMHFGNLIRGNSGWEFEAVGLADNANSISEFRDKINKNR